MSISQFLVAQSIKDIIKTGDSIPGPAFKHHIFSVEFWSGFIFKILKKTTILIIRGLVNISGVICILIAAAGILSYILGYKKGLRYTSGSISFYIIVRLFNMALN